ncbi:MAG: hypothetical protein ACYCUX_13170, partial [Metallibacterium sp.]
MPLTEASLGARLTPRLEQLLRIRSEIQPDRATPSSEVKGSLGAAEGMHTTHFSILDAKGNAV